MLRWCVIVGCLLSWASSSAWAGVWPEVVDAVDVARGRTRAGDYEAALDVYRRRFTLGETEPSLMCNAAELLMALGRLDEAIEQYREAAIVLERSTDRDRRGDLRAVTLAYLGLAVALDRSGDGAASREALGRALATGGAPAILQEAARPDGDVFFVPPGDVFYYLGLVRQAEGRAGDAAAAFRSYLARDPRFARAARDHLVRLIAAASTSDRRRGANDLASPSGPSDPAGAGDWRVIREATVDADGPIPAPLIDAAWRLQPRLLERCLSGLIVDDAREPPAAGDPEAARAPDTNGADRAAGPSRDQPIRLSLTVRFGADGSVGAVAADTGARLPPGFVTCVEDEVRTGLRVGHPTRRKPTRARIEVLLAPAEPSGL